jgi:hypothetical protein
MEAIAKSYMRMGFIICEEMRKYLVIYEEAVSHIRPLPSGFSLYTKKISCFISVCKQFGR